MITNTKSSTIESGRIFTPTVQAICAIAVGTMLTGQLMESPLLLYLSHIGLSTSPKATFYVATTALGYLAPVFATIPLGHLGSRFGAGETLGAAFLLVAFGILLVIFSRSSKLLFLVGFAFYSACLALRILRFTIIGNVVPQRHRTFVLAIHQFMIPVGAVLAPVVWLVCQNWKGEITVIPSIFVLDRFSLDFFIGICICVICSVTCFTKLSGFVGNQTFEKSTTTLNEQSPIKAESQESLTKQLANENGDSYGSCKAEPTIKTELPVKRNEGDNISTTENDLHRNEYICLLFFVILLLCLRTIVIIMMVLFQPVLIHRFEADDALIGRTYLFTGVVSLLPPLLVAYISKFLDDRYILCFGLVLKLVGILLYLPLFTWMHIWQAIIGNLLVVHASVFCTTSSISLFTKIFPWSPNRLGYVWALSNIFPVLTQITLANSLVALFATWHFACFLVPAMLSFGMVLSPFGWRLLDSNNERTSR